MNKIGLKTKYSCIGGNNFDTMNRAYISIDADNVWIEYMKGCVNIRWVPNITPTEK